MSERVCVRARARVRVCGWVFVCVYVWCACTYRLFLLPIQALALIENVHLKDEGEERLWKSALLKLYLNLALCHFKQKKTQKTIRFCHKALDLDENSVKAHFRLGQVGVTGTLLGCVMSSYFSLWSTALYCRLTCCKVNLTSPRNTS